MKLCRSRPLVCAALLAAVVGTALMAGCGERQVVMVPVAPEPVPIVLDEIVAKAEAGESEWAIIWAVRQSRRAWPLPARKSCGAEPLSPARRLTAFKGWVKRVSS